MMSFSLILVAMIVFDIVILYNIEPPPEDTGEKIELLLGIFVMSPFIFIALLICGIKILVISIGDCYKVVNEL